MGDQLTADEIDYALSTASLACQSIVDDETTEEYFAGKCEDTIPLLRRIETALSTTEAALATTIEQRDQAEHQAAAAEAALAEAIQQRDEAYAHDEAVTTTTGGALRIAVEKLNAAEAERKEQLWRAEWQQITDTAERLQAALAESRGERDTLRKALGLARAELARWGWGDHHYGSGQPQEKSVTDVLAAIDVAMGQNGDWRGRMANDEAEFGTGRSQNLRTVIRDGEPQWQLRCPGCGVWADIDDDQLHGRVSVEHTPGSDDKGYAGPTGCGYHETRDWWTLEAPHEST